MRPISIPSLLPLLLGVASVTHALPLDGDSNGDGSLLKRATVTVEAPAGTIVGRQDLQTEAFNGIPFAHAPVGDLRLRPPQRLEDNALQNYDGTTYSAACPQFLVEVNGNQFFDQVASLVTESPLFKKVLKESEDCLNLNVFRPKGVKAGDNLPVLFWMYGGGFELGWNSMYDGTSLVAEAASAGKPYVFVAVNYRLGAWGWLGGKDLQKEGSTNLGHLDQRMGLEWVADNIAAFGGDPSKVTIMGESAGSISVFHQMAAYDGDNTYKGKPLFRGAFMSSGSMTALDAIDGQKAQNVYDHVVKTSGCDKATAQERLACLRALPLDAFTKAANSVDGLFSYSSVAIQYRPRPDGKFLTASPQILAREGRYAKVPFIIGDQEDEGTLFSLFQSNTSSTTEGLINYFQSVYYPTAPRETIAQLVQAYPQSLTEGSPFRTSIFNEIYPGFKRIAAIAGDVTFTLARRLLLEEASGNVNAWSYIASHAYGTPILGTFHASDLVQIIFGVPKNYASTNVRKYLANFVYNLDPNNDSGGTGSGSSKVGVNWPKWTGADRTLVNFNAFSFQTLKDDFRSAAYDVIKKNFDSYAF